MLPPNQEDQNQENFHQRLKFARNQSGYTQKSLAEKLHISQQAYAKYETGKCSPNPETLSAICRTLKISADTLIHNPYTHPPELLEVSHQKIPLLGDIACGNPQYAYETQEIFQGYLPEGHRSDFCLRAKGDSMNGAGIHEGDIVFIRKQEQVENGEIGAVLIDDEATLKRVYFDKKNAELKLFPENPEYRPMYYREEELSQIRIIGKAVAIYSDL